MTTMRNRDQFQRLGKLFESVTVFGAVAAEDATGRHGDRTVSEAQDQGKFSKFRPGLATIVSVIALAFSGFSFYETVLKQARLRVYQPPLIHMFREGYRDVFAIPITISNDGARRGTVLSFDLSVTNLDTSQSKSFQNLHFGKSPKEETRLFNPITVPGRSSFTDVVLFHALETGAFMKTTGGVVLPLRLTLKMNLDGSGEWLGPAQPKALVFDMTANYVAGFRDMENGRPTRLHDVRWQKSNAKAGK